MPLVFKSLPASEKSTGDRRLTDVFHSRAGLIYQIKDNCKPHITGLDLSDKSRRIHIVCGNIKNKKSACTGRFGVIVFVSLLKKSG